MTDESDAPKSWFERLSHALLREPQDREQLISLLRDAKQRQLLDDDALRMIEGVLQVSEMKVRDVMIPRPQMVMIKHDMTPEQALPVIIESTHSRFPVIGEDRDEVIGILLAKDLLPYRVGQDPTTVQIRALIRPAIFIPESKRLDVLLNEFRLNRNHMAVVVDEYGGIAGLVTIEDVLEQIVGNIEDEYDITSEEPNIRPMSDAEYVVKALTPIDEFNEYFRTSYSDEDFDTIGGLILQRFSHLPKRGESIEFDTFLVTVLNASNRGIQLLQFGKMQSD